MALEQPTFARQLSNRRPAFIKASASTGEGAAAPVPSAAGRTIHAALQRHLGAASLIARLANRAARLQTRAIDTRIGTAARSSEQGERACSRVSALRSKRRGTREKFARLCRQTDLGAILQRVKPGIDPAGLQPRLPLELAAT